MGGGTRHSGRSAPQLEQALNGFGFNGADRDVYLEVLNKQSVIDVYDTLRVRLFNTLVSLAFLNSRYQPVMGVAQSLSPLQFLNAIRDYERTVYTNNFRISRLHVLKRKAPFNTQIKHFINTPLALVQQPADRAVPAAAAVSARAARLNG